MPFSRSSRRTFFVALGGSAILCAGSTAAPAGDAGTNHFGFSGPEIFPIANSIGHLRCADLDGDGWNDLVVVNNSRSKINLLYNQAGATNRTLQPAQGIKKEPNELPPDARFRIESIASEKRISSLVVADLNGDGRPDLAYYGEPKELIVQYHQGTNGWSAPRRWPIDDGNLEATSLAAGDLDGDGRQDLVLLSEKQLYFLRQGADGALGEPEKLPLTGTVKAVQILDVNGDGRQDLLLVNWESQTPFRYRLQNQDGQLGPELYFTMPPIHSYTAENLVTNGETQIITIAQNSGRAQVSHFTRKTGAPLSGAFREGQFSVQPLARTEKARRGLVWSDLNGDGRTDLCAAEPESGQLTVWFQNADGSLASPKTFPSLSGVSELRVADWDGDGKAELFLLSADENQVGVTRLDEKQRLPFPTLLPLEGKPLALTVGSLQPGGQPTLAMILEKDNRRILVTRTADGKTASQKLGENFKSNPTSITIHDVNQDGLPDLVVLIPYEKIKILLQVAGKDFEEIDLLPPGGADTERPWVSAADVDGDGKDELLLTQKNFLRAVMLKPEAAAGNATNKPGWTFRVKEQINGAASNSRLIGAARVFNGTNSVASLFLLDAERKSLTLCERDASGVWQVARNITLPAYADLGGTVLDTIAIGGRTTNAVALLGRDAVSWQALDGDTWEFTELDGYETPIKDGRLNDVVAGDLDNDGRKDLVFLEAAKNYLDLVIFDANQKLVPANRWQVFEERSFRGRRNDLPEPREAVVAEVTGDGRNDLVVLVHDRILVYPQE